MTSSCMATKRRSPKSSTASLVKVRVRSSPTRFLPARTGGGPSTGRSRLSRRRAERKTREPLVVPGTDDRPLLRVCCVVDRGAEGREKDVDEDAGARSRPAKLLDRLAKAPLLSEH